MGTQNLSTLPHFYPGEALEEDDYDEEEEEEGSDGEEGKHIEDIFNKC